MRILVADDNPEVLSHLTLLLEDEGHRVTGAGNGAEAFEALGEGSFDALVSDLEMPEVDGATLIRRARANWPDLGMVVVSSHPEAASIAAELGVRALPKSVSGPTLLAALAAARSHTASGAIKPAEPQQIPGPPVIFRPSSRGSRSPAGSWGIWAAAALALVVLAPFLFQLQLDLGDNPPALPDRPAPGALRGTGLEIFEPSGPLASAPLRLRWETLDGAASHRIAFERIDGQVIFQHSTPWQVDAEGNHVFDLPEEFRESLQPMAVYHWWVEALDTDGLSIARSRRERFRILIDPYPTSSTGDSR